MCVCFFVLFFHVSANKQTIVQLIDSSDLHRVIVLKKLKEIKRELCKAEKELSLWKTPHSFNN